MLSRRKILATAAAGAMSAATARAATFGNPDQPAEGAVNATNPRALIDPGPQDPSLAGNEPAFRNPPRTDVNGMSQFWSSFNLAPKRIQNGGWARQITSDDFKISSTISGQHAARPKRRSRASLAPASGMGGLTYGTCRVTILDQDGRPQVADVTEGGLWYFPAGLPHSLQGLDPDGTEFVIAFDNGDLSEFNTLLVTDWLAHTPLEVLSKNFGLPVDAFKNIPLHNKWIYQSDIPAPPLEKVEEQFAAAAGKPPNPYVFRAEDFKPLVDTKSGSVRLADSTNFLVSKTIAATVVTIKPGGLRDMHWHPNADEWNYWIKGQGRVTVFNTGPQAITANFHPGDIGYVKKAFGHYVENIGDTDLVYIEVFRADRFEEVSLSDWLAHSPIDMVAETLNIDSSLLAQIPKNRSDLVPI